MSWARHLILQECIVDWLNTANQGPCAPWFNIDGVIKNRWIPYRVVGVTHEMLMMAWRSHHDLPVNALPMGWACAPLMICNGYETCDLIRFDPDIEVVVDDQNCLETDVWKHHPEQGRCLMSTSPWAKTTIHAWLASFDIYMRPATGYAIVPPITWLTPVCPEGLPEDWFESDKCLDLATFSRFTFNLSAPNSSGL